MQQPPRADMLQRFDRARYPRLRAEREPLAIAARGSCYPPGSLALAVRAEHYDVDPDAIVTGTPLVRPGRGGMDNLKHGASGDVRGVGADGIRLRDLYLDGDYRAVTGDRDQVQPVPASLAVPVEHREPAGLDQSRGLREHGGPVSGNLVHEAFSGPDDAGDGFASRRSPKAPRPAPGTHTGRPGSQECFPGKEKESARPAPAGEEKAPPGCPGRAAQLRTAGAAHHDRRKGGSPLAPGDQAHD